MSYIPTPRPQVREMMKKDSSEEAAAKAEVIDDPEADDLNEKTYSASRETVERVALEGEEPVRKGQEPPPAGDEPSAAAAAAAAGGKAVRVVKETRLYSVLGVETDATSVQIKKAYYRVREGWGVSRRRTSVALTPGVQEPENRMQSKPEGLTPRCSILPYPCVTPTPLPPHSCSLPSPSPLAFPSSSPRSTTLTRMRATRRQRSSSRKLPRRTRWALLCQHMPVVVLHETVSQILLRYSALCLSYRWYFRNVPLLCPPTLFFC